MRYLNPKYLKFRIRQFIWPEGHCNLCGHSDSEHIAGKCDFCADILSAPEDCRHVISTPCANVDMNER